MGRRRVSPFLTVGLPFLTLVVGMSVGLSYFVVEGNEMKDERHRVTVTEKELKKQQKNRESFDMVKEYRRIVESLPDTYENKRIPRPEGSQQQKPKQ